MVRAWPVLLVVLMLGASGQSAARLHAQRVTAPPAPTLSHGHLLPTVPTVIATPTLTIPLLPTAPVTPTVTITHPLPAETSAPLTATALVPAAPTNPPITPTMPTTTATRTPELPATPTVLPPATPSAPPSTWRLRQRGDATYATQALVATPWTNTDIGVVGAAGNATQPTATSFTVQGSGADIGGTADAFQFVYQPLAGDGEIIARVASVQNTNNRAEAGVMIRDTLAVNAVNVFMAVTAGRGVEFEARTTTGGTSTRTRTGAGGAPYWVRLVRSGTTLRGYQSTDGVTWTPSASTTIALSTTVYVGLAVCSHVVGTLTTATFDNVQVIRPAAAGSLTITNPLVADFPVVPLADTVQQAQTSLAAFSVEDTRSTSAGWRVTVGATPLREVDGSGAYVGGGRTLGTGSLTLAQPTVVANGTTAPSLTVVLGPYLIDTGTVTIASAAVGTGTGRYDFSATTMTVSIPPSAYATTYRSDVTVSVVSGP